MNIHVSNLGNQVTEESLNAMFSTYGEVQSVNIMLDQFTGKLRDFAYVDMPNDIEAYKAIDKLNGAVINGLHIKVKEGPLLKLLAGSYPVGRK